MSYNTEQPQEVENNSKLIARNPKELKSANNLNGQGRRFPSQASRRKDSPVVTLMVARKTQLVLLTCKTVR